MADVEEPQHYTTLAERIAALNKQKNFKEPPAKPLTKPRAPPPPPISNGFQKSPTLPARPASKEITPQLPRRTTATAEQDEAKSPPLPSRNLVPPLPHRNSTQQVSPSLPPRRTSTQYSARRNSNESDKSYVSTVSGLSLHHTSSVTSIGSVDGQPARKLPPTLDQAKLPPLPPSRREIEAKAKEEAAAQGKAPLIASKSSPAVPRAIEPPPRPSLPPRLPTRPARSPGTTQAQAQAQAQETAAPVLPARRLPPPPSSYVRPKSALENGFGGGKKVNGDAPPPVPLASRPTFAQIDAAARAPAAVPKDACCLICRDFSGPDNAAAQYPIASLPRQDPIGYLAHHLCSPFPSHTDKARAVFTWCHHNIAYDVDGFFGGCIPRGQTPEQSLLSGKAVCEGYAKVYHSLAERAGLECYVVGGHGKGFGFAPLGPGDPIPPVDASGHAWNAVRIDNGEWKLLDACWGAGNVCDKRAERYEKKFNPSMFNMSNEKFGERHFPEDSRHFYRSDGRPLPWQEYIVEKMKEEPATLYSNAEAEGITEETMTPAAKNIPVYSGEVVRFQFGKHCPHWTYEKHGGGKIPYLLMMKIFGVDGRKEDLVPMEYDGFWWYVDIPAKDLGAPGQQIFCYALSTLNNRDARGVSKADFLAKKGRCSMSWVGIATWQLV